MATFTVGSTSPGPLRQASRTLSTPLATITGPGTYPCRQEHEQRRRHEVGPEAHRALDRGPRAEDQRGQQRLGARHGGRRYAEEWVSR